MSNCNNNSNNNCPAAEKYYNTSGKRFNVADVNAGCAAAPPYYGQQNRNANCGNAEMMGSPDMSASCPPGRRYNKAGRPFTRADINTFAANTGNLISETCSQDESSYNQSRGPPLNPSPRSRNVLAQSAPMGRCFDHEEEMARNQQIALHRLRAELETNACQRSPDRSPERSPVRSKRTCPTPPAKCRLEPVNSGSYRGRSFDPQAEIERQKAKANMCLAKKDRNVLAGRRIDLDRLVDYNVQSCETYTAGGRRMDVDRDLNRRLPSPKGQRASSCPTPMPSVAQCAPAAPRPAQVCPQHSAAACPSPTRSANTSRSNSPNCPNTARPPMRCPATPTVCPPTPAPPCNITVTTTTRTTAIPVVPPRSATGSPTRSPTGSPTRSPTGSPTRAPTGAPTRSPTGSPTRSPDRQNNTPPANVRPSGSPPQIDPHYGDPKQTIFPPLGTPMPYPVDTTPQSPNPNLQNTYTVNNSGPPPTGFPMLDVSSPNLVFSARESAPPYPSSRFNFRPMEAPGALSPSDIRNFMQLDVDTRPRRDPNYIEPSNYRQIFEDNRARRDPNYVEPSIMDPFYDDDDDPSADERCLTRNISSNSGYSPCPLESFVDLTDETANDCAMRQASQYSNQTSDMSGRDRTNGSACQNNSHNSNASNCATPPPANCSANAWQNPPQNMSCNDGNNYQNRMSSTMNPSGFGNTFCVDDMMDSEYMCDACNKTYLPNRPCPPEIKPGSTCPPRASIFRCLAKKLSSTYDFISSFVSNSEPKSQPECATSPAPECSRPSSSSGQNCCPYSSPNDTTNFGMERLFETQHNPNAPTGKPGSIQECANAKRCGRVQFDSSDSPLEPNQKAIRKAQVETLVNDSFCPGLIQATIDGQENFNNYAFNITLGKDAKDTSKCDRPPPEEPITLLEAFSLRIAQERENVNKQLPTNAAADQILDIIDKEFAAKLPSDLNRSIKDLLLSERTKEHEQVEQAKEKSFDSEVQKVRTSFPDNPKVKLDVYTGHTNPSND